MNTEVDCKTPTCNRTFHSTVHVCSCESSIVLLGLVDSVVWRLTEIHAARIVIFTRVRGFHELRCIVAAGIASYSGLSNCIIYHNLYHRCKCYRK